jgi:hypothetical protein
MAKKELTPEQWSRLEKTFNPNYCTLSVSSLVADGFARTIESIDREMFDNETKGGEVIKGNILSQNGRFFKINVEGEIINVKIKLA